MNAGAGFQLLVFDFGLRRTGVAIGESVTGQARPLPTLAMSNGTPDWKEVEQLVAYWRPNGLLVGLPLDLDGEVTDMTRRADKFRRRLHGRLGLPALAWDERLTSQMVKQAARARGITDFGAHSVDSEAAVLVFESWFASLTDRSDWQSHTMDLP